MCFVRLQGDKTFRKLVIFIMNSMLFKRYIKTSKYDM